VLLAGVLPLTAFQLGFTASLNAADLKYTYAQAKYIVNTDESAGNDADGFGFDGSYRIDDNLFAVAEFSTVEADEIEIETQSMLGGLGYIHPISDSWNGEFLFIFGKIDVDYPKNITINGRRVKDEDDTGYKLKTGARASLTSQLDFRAHVCYQSFFDDNWTSLELTTDYFIKPDISASLAFGLDEDGGSFTIGGKVYF
jgi:hypothetical protein